MKTYRKPVYDTFQEWTRCGHDGELLKACGSDRAPYLRCPHCGTVYTAGEAWEAYDQATFWEAVDRRFDDVTGEIQEPASDWIEVPSIVKPEPVRNVFDRLALALGIL